MRLDNPPAIAAVPTTRPMAANIKPFVHKAKIMVKDPNPVSGGIKSIVADPMPLAKKQNR